MALIFPDEHRCLEHRADAFKTSNESGIPIFIPVCRADGRYVEVQCHYGTGYCWCVNLDGKPVPGSSIRYDRPKCNKGKKKTLHILIQLTFVKCSRKGRQNSPERKQKESEQEKV
jgi:hypothetical protein